MTGTKQMEASRSTLYQLLEAPFVFPTEASTSSFIDGTWKARVIEHASVIGFELPDNLDLRLAAPAKEFEVEFIALFEVGMGGAPCPLHSGHYTKDRLSTMEEVLRFYRFFGFDPDRSADRFPDHINFELQFMCHLTRAYLDAELEHRDIASPILAQRDFATRNLLSWLPQLDQLINKKANIDFFKHTSRLLNAFVAFDVKALERLASQFDEPKETVQ